MTKMAIVLQFRQADICPLRNRIVLFCRWWLVLMVSLFENGLLRYVSKRGGVHKILLITCETALQFVVINLFFYSTRLLNCVVTLVICVEPQLCQGCWLLTIFRWWSFQILWSTDEMVSLFENGLLSFMSKRGVFFKFC